MITSTILPPRIVPADLFKASTNGCGSLLVRYAENGSLFSMQGAAGAVAYVQSFDDKRFHQTRGAELSHPEPSNGHSAITCVYVGGY